MKNVSPGFIKNALGFIKANAAQFATAGIVVGVVGAVILAVKAGRETQQDLEELSEENSGQLPEFKVIVRKVWKHFIPVIILVVATVSGVIWNSGRLIKQCAAISSAYALTSSYLEDYVQSTKEAMSPRKEQAIRDAAGEKQFHRAELAESGPAPRGITETGKGTVLFYDYCTGYMFRSTRDAVKAGISTLYDIFNNDMQISLDDYIDAITSGHIKRYGSIGNYLGVIKDRTPNDSSLRIDTNSTGLSDRDEPYIIVHMDNFLTNLY